MRGVLLVVIDCLRADHVSSYGYGRSTTPTIDELAGEGVLWEQAYSTSSWTKPSVASLLTGLYPSEHGAFEGVKRSRGRTTITTDRVCNLPWMLAEQFTQSGWRCGAFINNAQLGEFTGLNRGFQKYVPNAGKADGLIGSFREWLTSDLETPSFAYLHLLEAHWPYKPRRRHVKEFGGDRDTNCFNGYSAQEYGLLRRAVTRGERTLSEDELVQMVQMYDGAVRRLDGKIKVLRAMLEELGVADEFAIVVTADHGDEFLDHASIGHGHTLYDELTHVPLVAHIPQGPSGVRCTAPVSLVDLAGTLLGMAGVENTGPSRDLLSDAQAPRPVFGELRMGRRYQQFARTAFWKLHRTCKFEPSNGELDRCGSPRQLFKSCAQDVQCLLFDMLRDPHETRNLACKSEYDGVLNSHVKEMDRWWRGLSEPPEQQARGDVEIDSEIVNRLFELGYID